MNGKQSINNMKIIKTPDGEIRREFEPNMREKVVRRISDGMLGYVLKGNGDGLVVWRDDIKTSLSDVTNDIEYVQIPKPEGYDNPYEEFYGEGGIFWPLPGTKIRYKGTHKFWFTNIVKNAEDNLEIGKEYTIKSISPASSWCEVMVKEFPDMSLALSFFDYE